MMFDAEACMANVTAVDVPGASSPEEIDAEGGLLGGKGESFGGKGGKGKKGADAAKGKIMEIVGSFASMLFGGASDGWDGGWDKGGWGKGYDKGGWEKGWGKGYDKGGWDKGKGKGKGWGDGGWSDGGWGNGGGAAWVDPSTMPETHWISFPPSFPLVEEKGMPAEAPALLHDKTKDIFQRATILINSVTSKGAYEIEHDAEWDKYPEVGHAWKALTGEEECFAIATSAQHGKWGIGISSGTKGREAAAKVALAVAIVQGFEKEGEIRWRHPDFAALLDRGVKGRGKKRKANTLAKSIGSGIGEQDDDEAPEDEAPAAKLNTYGPKICTVTLSETPARLKEFHPFHPAAKAIAHDKEYKGLFNKSEAILKCLMGDGEPEIIHDADWTELPEIGEALVPSGLPEDCVCVAMCSIYGKWAIGVGGGWKTRESAARLALSIAIAPDSATIEVAKSEFPQFAKFYEGIR